LDVYAGRRGGLWYSWLDRDLSVAGRAIVEGSTPGTFESRLVCVDRPILRIPSLAIHLNRGVNTDGLKLNAEDHLAPVLCTAVKAQLDAASAPTPSTPVVPGTGDATTRHHPLLMQILAQELGVSAAAIKDFDLCLYDTQKAAIGGAKNEFIFAARLDNLMMTFTCFESLLASTAAADALAEEANIRVAAAFDHEECGSDSVPGAGSSFLEDLLKRLCPDPALQPIMARRSILVSADMAHAVHPNYAGLHEENHRPNMHKGVVIKSNANQRYATTNVTSFFFRQMAAEAGTPVQSFVVRQDMGCGSTIGPIVATRLGFRTVDVGIPQLSMHSIREMCGVDDVSYANTFLAHFYKRFPSLDAAVAHAD
jgi:aspartyl aminopeptidase